MGPLGAAAEGLSVPSIAIEQGDCPREGGMDGLRVDRALSLPCDMFSGSNVLVLIVGINERAGDLFAPVCPECDRRV